MKKKLLSIFLSMAIVLGLVPAMPIATVFAAERTCVIDGVTYGFRLVNSILGTSAALQSVSTRKTHLVLPEYVYAEMDSKYRITSIDNRALENNNIIEKVTLNADCYDIGAYAFANCKNLKSITFNNVITHIGQNAFYGSGLESVTLPDSITSVDQYAFASCPNLKTFKCGYGLAAVGDRVLNSCSSLEKIILNRGLSEIGEYALGYNGTTKNTNVKFRVVRNSTGHTYAQDNGFEYKYDIEAVYIEGLKNKKYTGKPITQKFYVNDLNIRLKEGVDYTTKFSKNVNPGYAKVTITGIGMYEGTKTTTFFIKPVVKQVTKVKTSVKKGKITVKWKKLSNISGYQISYSKNKNFKGKTVIKAGKSATSKTTKKLKKGKYYVKVRAYKTISGITTYGPFSTVKTAKVK